MLPDPTYLANVSTWGYKVREVYKLCRVIMLSHYIEDANYVVNWMYKELGARAGDVTFISNEWVINGHLAGNVPEWATPGYETLLYGNVLLSPNAYSGEYG